MAAVDLDGAVIMVIANGKLNYLASPAYWLERNREASVVRVFAIEDGLNE